MSARLTPTAFQEECSRRDTLSVTMRPLVSLPYKPDFLEYLMAMDSPTSLLNMVTRMGSNVEVADFVTVAMRFANQHLAHVPTIAAGQTTLAEPRHQPAVAPGVSTATWPRPSTANNRRLTRVSDGAPGPVASEHSRINAQAPPSWANLVDLDTIVWSDEQYHRYHAMLLCRNMQLAGDAGTRALIEDPRRWRPQINTVGNGRT